MKVTFTKEGPRRYSVYVSRERYVDLRCGSIGYDDWLPHDLLHFVAEAESCLMTLRLMSYDRRIKELAADIARADRAGDDALRDRLVMENLELNRRRTALLPHAGSVTPGGPSY